jgi:tyrosyl-tRNA synthetase
VIKYLRLFTFLEQARILELENALEERPHEREAHKTLGWEVTAIVHGSDEADKVVRASQVLFGAPIEDLDEAQILSIFADVPSIEVSRASFEGEGLAIVEALTESGLCKSNGEARRRVEGGGIYVNNVRWEDARGNLTLENLASENTLILRGGKKNYCLIRLMG